jgi:hypothetical protein
MAQTHKRKYLTALRAQTTEWLEAHAARPSQYMGRTHVALTLIELRRRGRIVSHYADTAQNEGWQ